MQLTLVLLMAGVMHGQYLAYSFHANPVHGQQVYKAACASCHGSGGKGAPQTLTAFKRPDIFPDFSRCDQTTAEVNTAYKAVITNGGPNRGFSQIMPAFGEALSSQDIDDVVAYLREFCPTAHWPRGELNLPRAIVTEKAYPEAELVLSTGINANGTPGNETHIIHEQRFGQKNQIEVDVPIVFQDQDHTWYGGVGDITLGLKRVMFSSLRTGSILSLQGGFLLPTGNYQRGFGAGTTTFEPFAAFDQVFRSNTFLQLQFGADLPFDTSKSPQSLFFNSAVGQSFAGDHGMGRLWSPMCEFLARRDLVNNAKTDWDVMPEMQVTISQRQHIRGSLGLRVPVSNTEGRQKQVMFYLLWDWADGKFWEGMVKRRNWQWLMLAVAALLLPLGALRGADQKSQPQVEFHTSDRCLACHNQLTTPDGNDVSIGTAWRASIMANSSRDPYWQGSIRRETIDHPTVKRDIEDECSACHMPVTRYEAKIRGEKGKVFDYLPFPTSGGDAAKAEDGVTCSVCHQISKQKLGTRESFSGEFVIERPSAPDNRPEYGPFVITPGHQRVMDSSTGGFRPTYAEHIRDSALCGSCHQLYTTARGEGGKDIGTLPEQMPYLEWLHSDYPQKQSCQQCHMPEVQQETTISSVLGVPRAGLHQHVFVGGDFFMQKILNRYRDELDVAALPQELSAAAEDTLRFVQSQAAKIELRNIEIVSGKLQAEVYVQNLTGHKLPTAYPSRRAWLHFVVRDRNGNAVFESGAINPDGSIAGNDNDSDKTRYEPHYREIASPEQVEIYEDIMGDPEGKVTTGLLAAVRYLKDNRLLPTGFDKRNAVHDVAVVGDAFDDPNFTAGSDLVRYAVPVAAGQGPFHVEVELWYQPIGYRWAHNLEPYQAMEPQRFVSYYDAMSKDSATVLARAEATR